MRIVSASYLALLILIAAGGCSNEKAPPLTPASGKTPTAEDAIAALASAQCNYQQRCGHVGEDQDYATREHCMSKTTTELRRQLSSCDKRLDDNDVRQCAGAIEAQSCSDVMDEVERFFACKTDDLCD